jgi:hypothetical protein
MWKGRELGRRLQKSSELSKRHPLARLPFERKEVAMQYALLISGDESAAEKAPAEAKDAIMKGFDAFTASILKDPQHAAMRDELQVRADRGLRDAAGYARMAAAATRPMLEQARAKRAAAKRVPMLYLPRSARHRPAGAPAIERREGAARWLVKRAVVGSIPG